MSSRKCKYDADAFCYICGQFIKVRDVKYELNTSHVLCEAYEAYFDRPVRNQDKTWAPHVACSYCKRCLEGWYRGAKRSMKFAIPRIWREPKDHVNDYYFCIVNPSKRRRGKNAKPIEYPDLESSSAPVAHNLTRPVPELPQKSSSFLSSHRSNSDFNDLIRDLNLPKRKAELLGSRLKQWYLLDDVNITDQQTRHETFSTFFTKEDGLCFCNDIKVLTGESFHQKRMNLLKSSGKRGGFWQICLLLGLLTSNNTSHETLRTYIYNLNVQDIFKFIWNFIFPRICKQNSTATHLLCCSPYNFDQNKSELLGKNTQNIEEPTNEL
nr:uncharacterized protein LOC111421790 isoform X3 [Onthophagus taurus]